MKNPPNRVDPDGETQPYQPENDPAFFPPSPQTNWTGPDDVTRGVYPYPAQTPGQEGATLPYLPPQPPEYPYAPYYGTGQPGTPPPYPPADPLGHYQSIPIPLQKQRRQARPSRSRPKRRSGLNCGCGCLGLGLFLVLLLSAAYFFVPLRTNFLLLGLDRAPEGTALSRTDTMILVSVNPLMPDVKMLSIPRDLWVPIPGVGENRINTVHFFAESEQPGSGPRTTLQVVRDTFNVPVSYYVRVRFDGVVGIVDAMGGVDLDLPDATSGYEAGRQHLDGAQALAFARDRSGTDDFFRMAHGQLLIKALVRQSISPLTWVRLPQIITAVAQMIDTNLPFWQWPRIGLAFVRAVLSAGIDNRTFDRQMAAPYITSGGAQVLLPQWELINPVVREMFGAPGQLW